MQSCILASLRHRITGRERGSEVGNSETSLLILHSTRVVVSYLCKERPVATWCQKKACATGSDASADDSVPSRSNAEHSSSRPQVQQEVKEESLSDGFEDAGSQERKPTPAMASMVPLLPPPVLDLEAENLEEKCRHFKFIHEQRMIAADIPATELGKRASAFVMALPEQAQYIIMDHDFTKSGKDRNNVDDLIKIICDSKKKKSSRIVARNRFLNRAMRPGEKFSEFKKAILQLADMCGYETKIKNELIRDHIIRVHNDEALQYELLKLPDDATLDNVIDMCDLHDDTVEAAKQIQASQQQQPYSVNAVGTKNKNHGKPKASPKPSPKPQPKQQSSQGGAGPSGYQTPKQPSSSGKKKDEPGSTILCTWFCGTRHERGADNCPASKAICTKCGGRNHFEEVCRRPPAHQDWKPRSEQSAQNHRRLQQAFSVTEVGSQDEDDEYEEANAVGYEHGEILRSKGKEKNPPLVSPPIKMREVKVTPPSLIIAAKQKRGTGDVERRVMHGKPASMTVTTRSAEKATGRRELETKTERSQQQHRRHEPNQRQEKSPPRRRHSPARHKQSRREMSSVGNRAEKKSKGASQDEKKKEKRPGRREDRSRSPLSPKLKSVVEKPRPRHRSPAPVRGGTQTRSPVRRPQPEAAAAEKKPATTKNMRQEEELNFEPPTDDENETVNEVSSQKRKVSKARTWDENVIVNGRPLKMKVDSGSTVCTISWRDFQKLGLTEDILTPPRRRIVTYCKGMVEPLGEFVATLKLRGRTTRTKVLLLEEECAPLLSCSAGLELGLFKMSRDSLVEYTFEYEDMWSYDGIDAAEDEFLRPCHKTVKIELKPGAEPVVVPPRRISLALREETYHELQRMQKMGVISPVNEPRPWCHAMVVARKPNGKLRVCIDPRTINPWIEREHMQIPNIDGILLDLEKAKVFTLIDLQAAFWQVAVDQDSAKLLTFATPWGRYQYNRLPFGISIAPEIFHKAVSDLLQGIPGVVVYLDDIFIYAETDEEHDERFEEVKRRLEQGSFTWNPAKCHVKQKSVKFLGHVIGNGEVRPDPEKIEALLRFPKPRCRKDLKGFVGLVSWLRKFVPELNRHLSVFRPLQRDRTPWVWTETESQAFQAVKETMKNITPLMMIRQGEPMILSVDASSYGLGAALLQLDTEGNERPVFFASRLMTDTEREYPQIDKEFLAIVWAMERLDAFVYGQEVRIRTDHRPLLGIMKKPMAHMSTRQQRFVARLMRYSVKLEYVPGKEMFVADFLSRAVNEKGPECRCMMMGTDIRVEDAFVSLLSTIPVSDELTKKIVDDVTRDAEYVTTLQAYAASFPHKMAKECGEYWSMREMLTAEDGLLYFEGRVVVPRDARKRILESLHRGHVGVSTMTRRASETVWWPGIVNDMKQKARCCGDCQVELPMQPREPMLSFEVPPAPGIVVHADHFELSAKDYLILVDGFSGWTEALLARNKSRREVMRLLRGYMMRNGVPRQFHSDQGSAFTAAEFADFAREWGIRVTQGSAKHPRGNAVAEAHVKKIKKILRTARDDDDLAKALLAMHQTPLALGRPTPAQLHLGRNLRDELHPKVVQTQVEWEEWRAWKEAVAVERKIQFDKGTRELPLVEPGTTVLVHHQGRWQRASIIRRMERPRSYELQLEKTRIKIQRNRHLIRVIDQKSSAPLTKRANPSSLLQETRRPLALQLLKLTRAEDGNDGSNRPGTSPDHELNPNSNPAVPRLSSSSSPPGPSSSSSSPATLSSRSYASVLESPTTPGSRESEDTSGSEDEPTISSPEMTSSDEDDGRQSPSPGHRVMKTPRAQTRAGRVVRSPDRWSPPPITARRRK